MTAWTYAALAVAFVFFVRSWRANSARKAAETFAEDETGKYSVLCSLHDSAEKDFGRVSAELRTARREHEETKRSLRAHRMAINNMRIREQGYKERERRLLRQIARMDDDPNAPQRVGDHKRNTEGYLVESDAGIEGCSIRVRPKA